MRSQIAGQILKNSENWVLAILGVLGTVFVIQTFGYRFSAALFPRLVNTVLAALCLFRLGGNIFRTQNLLGSALDGLLPKPISRWNTASLPAQAARALPCNKFASVQFPNLNTRKRVPGFGQRKLA